tara:strand:+ start:114 stop:434 length:321 start_codon:yes stop_codon:yes gene_type:complete
MDKQQYKEMVAELIEEKILLKEQLHNSKQEVLKLTIKNAELTDQLKNYNCYAETDGLEVGSPSDYEDTRSDEWRIEQFNRNRAVEDQVSTIEEMETKVSEMFNKTN